MKTLVCIVVAGVFVNTVKAVQPKQVNLALETVLQFDKKDQPEDLTIIDQVQNVLQKIKDAMRYRSGRRRNTDDISFTDFVLEAARILRDYNDNDLEDVYAVIDDESRRFVNRDSKLQELFGNNVRRYVSSQLDVLKDMPAETLRRHLDTAIDVLENSENAREIREILDLGNTLYHGAGDKLKTALKNLERVRRSNGDVLENILRSTIKSLIFDHYSNLNYNVRGDLFQMAKNFWEAFSSTNGDDKNTNQKFQTVKRLPVSNERGVKYTDKHRIHLSTKNKITTRKISHWNEKSYNIGHKNRFVKIGPKDKSKTHKDQEIFLTHSELKKLTNNTNFIEVSQDKKYVPSRYIKDNIEKSKAKKSRLQRKYKTRNKGKVKKDLRTSNSKKTTEVGSTDSNESQLLTGGQALQDIHLRVETSPEIFEHPIETVDETRTTKEFSNRYGSVELSLKNSGQSSESSTSVERYGTDDSKNGEEEDDASRSKQAPTFRATASIEGITIESFENDGNVVRKVTRKSNVNDTLLIDVNPSAPENVKKLIENIEKEIEDVKEQVEYVKNLKTGDMIDQPKFKAADSDEISFDKSTNTSVNNNSNSNSIERDNIAFLSADSGEKITGAVAFRAHDDSDTNKYSAELENTQNSTKTTLAENTIDITATTTDHTINKTKVDIATENTNESIKDNKTNSDNLNKEKVSNTDGNNEVDKVDDGNAIHTSDGKEPNEKSLTNITALEVTKNESSKNTISQNATSTGEVKLV